ncbi:uncharacterized protein ISCGN_016023 [Ixodes scapularis]
MGLHVVAITTDMGSGNRAMWKYFGISAGKYSRVSNKFKHPCREDADIAVLADVPHVAKNLCGHLLRKQKITLSDAVVAENNLNSNIVTIQPVVRLIEFQEQQTFKLAPNLQKELLEPNQFEKMKVSNALRILSRSTSSALRFMVENYGWEKDVLTTAWFIEHVNRWFELMSSRHPTTALSFFDSERYSEALTFLNKFKDMFTSLKIDTGTFKPVQTGVILSTSSILYLQDLLLHEEGFTFVLISRFTQDSLENFFSSVRRRNPIPTPVEFKSALRIITLSQYLKPVRNSSYELDDEAFYLADLSDIPEATRVEPVETDEDDPPTVTELSESNSFYYYCGYIVSRVVKNDSVCDECIAAVKAVEGQTVLGNLTRLKAYKEGCLVFISDSVLELLTRCEATFTARISSLLNSSNIANTLAAEMKARNHSLPECHDIAGKIIGRFCRARVRLYVKELSKKELNKKTVGTDLSSKSMAAPRRR